MALLIDGYNLLHVTGLFGKGSGPGGFHRSRMALLGYLARALPPEERVRTTVVFDAAGAPPGLPRAFQHEGLSVRFARGYASADDLIEELIDQEHAPRQLVVVSSDHRIQRAAGRRRARAIDSDRWFGDLRRQNAGLDRAAREGGSVGASAPGKPGEPSQAEVDYWLREFGLADGELSEAFAAGSQTGHPAGDDLFPPGYADDLEWDEEPPAR